MESLHEDHPVVQNSALIAACTWADTHGPKHFHGHIAPQMKRCLQRFIAILDPDDPVDRRYFEDPKAFLDDTQRISDVYVNLKGTPGSTARNYILKAARLVTEFLRYQESPTNYAPLKTFKRKRRSKQDQKSTPASGNVVISAHTNPVLPTTLPVAHASQAMRDFPLGNGRRFCFILPDPYGLNEEDGERIIAHLKTFITDEPTAPPPTPLLPPESAPCEAGSDI